MKFIVDSSLQTRALTSISATLWNKNDVRKCLALIFLPGIAEGLPIPAKWHIGIQMVEARVQNLDLPKSLENELSRFVHAVGFEILRWLHFHINKYGLIKKIVLPLAWTENGTVDLLKTAYVLLQDETIDLVDRFKLACLYCIEEYVFKLWDQLDHESRYKMHRFTGCFQLNPLVEFWCGYIKAKMPSTYPWEKQCDTFYEGFRDSLTTSNEVAAKFFFLRSTEEEKDTQLVRDLTTKFGILYHSQEFPIPLTTSNKQYAEILCFVLNSMSEDQQLKILRKIPKTILILFLEWPFQDLFLKLHRHVGSVFSGDEFCHLLKQMLKKPDTGCKDYDYERMFLQVWMQAPDDHREYVYDSRNNISFLLSSLCNVQFWTAFNHILKDVTPYERKRLLLCNELCQTYRSLISKERWNKIEGFVMKCLFNKQEVIEFRNKICYRSSRNITFNQFVGFNKIVDDYLMGSAKRLTEDDNNEPKKLCVAEV